MSDGGIHRLGPPVALLLGSDLGESTVAGTLPRNTCAQAKERLPPSYASVCRDFAVRSLGDGPARPLLLIDVDGVISLFGRPGASHERLAADGSPPDGSFHSIEGI